VGGEAGKGGAVEEAGGHEGEFEGEDDGAASEVGDACAAGRRCEAVPGMREEEGALGLGHYSSGLDEARSGSAGRAVASEAGRRLRLRMQGC
jgi:hypothetical protein